MKTNMFRAILPLVFAAVAASADASEFYNPADGDTGGCAAASYQNQDWYESGYFPYIPAMADGESVLVYGTGFRGVAFTISTDFTCNNGVIRGGWGYESSDVSWGTA